MSLIITPRRNYWTPLRLSGCQIWSESDFGTCTIDAGVPGSTYVTIPSLGEIAGGLRNLSKSTEPALSTLNGRNSAIYSAASSTFMSVLATKTQLRCLHDGSGCTLAMVINTTSLAALQTIYSDHRESTYTHHGLCVDITTAGAIAIKDSVGVAGAWNINTTTAAGTISQDATHRFIWQYSETATPKWRVIVNEAVKTSGTTTQTITSADSTGNPEVGRLANGGQPYSGHLPLFIVYNVYHTGADLLALQSYMKKWG